MKEFDKRCSSASVKKCLAGEKKVLPELGKILASFTPTLQHCFCFVNEIFGIYTAEEKLSKCVTVYIWHIKHY